MRPQSGHTSPLGHNCAGVVCGLQYIAGTGGVGDGAGGTGGVGGAGGVGTGAGTSPLHDGAGALASKVPVQISQFAADKWHQPVLSSPQSPQSAPNLQQPPEAGGAGPGEGGAGPPFDVSLQLEM